MDGMAETECWERGDVVGRHPAWPCSRHQTVPPVPPETQSSYSQAVLGVPWHPGSQVVLEDPAKKGGHEDGLALNISVTPCLGESDPSLTHLALLSSRCPSPIPTNTPPPPGTITILGHSPSPGSLG